jgi:preprotein translocase subunit SecA
MTNEDYTKYYLPYMFDLLQKARDFTSSQDDRLQASLDLLEVIDELAEDPFADVEDRKLALELQAQKSAYLRLHMADLIAVMSEVANSETNDQEDRDQATTILKRAAEQLRERGTDISHWIQPSSKRPQ